MEVSDSIVLVVSPLNALMRDQSIKLDSMQVLSAIIRSGEFVKLLCIRNGRTKSVQNYIRSFMGTQRRILENLGPIYTVRFLSHAASSRQAYNITYDCRSVLKHVLKCYDIFSDVHNNRKSCRGPVVSRCRMRQSRTV